MNICVPSLRRSPGWNQPIVAACDWTLLRPAAAAAVVVVPLLLLVKIPSRCQQPQFHWWCPLQVLFFPQPLLQTYSNLPCLDCCV